MADLGDVGLVQAFRVRRVIHCLDQLTLQAQPTGNGPITNTGLTPATANGLILLSDRGTARVDATRADGAGIWSFYDISVGRYTVADVTNNGQWFIDVAIDLTFTVTENPGAAVTISAGYA